MTDAQMYFAIGVPVFAIIMSVIGGMFQFSALGARITSLETNLGARLTSMENRFTNLESRFAGLEARFDTLTGKVIEIDNRLTRVEALLERH
jgi:hypothetical protein